MTIALECFYGYYNNHKNNVVLGKLSLVQCDFTEQLEESQSVKLTVKATARCFKELKTHPGSKISFSYFWSPLTVVECSTPPRQKALHTVTLAAVISHTLQSILSCQTEAPAPP